MNLNKITINNVNYYTVDQFAWLTKRSPQAIRLLIAKGNRFRKLKAMKIGWTWFVEASELTEYKFCCAGRSKKVVKFDVKGIEHYEILN